MPPEQTAPGLCMNEITWAIAGVRAREENWFLIRSYVDRQAVTFVFDAEPAAKFRSCLRPTRHMHLERSWISVLEVVSKLIYDAPVWRQSMIYPCSPCAEAVLAVQQ